MLLNNYFAQQDKKRDTAKSRFKLMNKFQQRSNISGIIDPTVDITEAYVPNVNEKEKKKTTKYVLDKKIIDFQTFINNTCSTLKYIKSGSTGQTYRGEMSCNNSSSLSFFNMKNSGEDKIVYALKICAYPKSEKYGNYDNISRPENAEIVMLKVLSYFVVKKITPHLMLPYCTFDTKIDYFIKPENVGRTRDDKHFDEFVTNYEKGKFHDHVSVLICEWANCGDLLDFIRKRYQSMTKIMWKVFFFQILSVLAVIHRKYPYFRHNDLKANNILVQSIKEKTTSTKYTINRVNYTVPNIGYRIKLWDFDFSCISGTVENKKVGNGWSTSLNITKDRNQYYDIHFFFLTLMTFFEKAKTKVFPQEVIEFINSIIPERLITGKFKDTVGMIKKKDKKGRIIGTTKGEKINVCYNGKRLLKNEEYTTPSEILLKNKYFDEFREKVDKDYFNNMSKNVSSESSSEKRKKRFEL